MSTEGDTGVAQANAASTAASSGENAPSGDTGEPTPLVCNLPDSGRGTAADPGKPNASIGLSSDAKEVSGSSETLQFHLTPSQKSQGRFIQPF